MPRTKRKPRSSRQPVRGSLKGFAEARKPSVELIRDVQTHVVSEGVKNADVGREQHKIHVSELVKDTACARYLYYKLTKAERTDLAPPAFHRLESIWAAGHDAHHKWQRWLHQMGDLWGTWTCLVCKHSWDDLAPKTCPKCDSDLLRYDEVNLEDEKYLVVGHADGAVPRLDALVEVKTFAVGTVRIDNPQLVREHTKKVDGKQIVDHVGLWNAIKRPLRSHLKQGMFYLWLSKRMGLPYKSIIFIYENKSTQMTKSFEVSLAERHIKDEITLLSDLVDHYIPSGIVPDRDPLFAPDSKPCKDCVFRTLCWETSDNDREESTAVSSGGSLHGSEAAGGEAEVHTPASSRARPTRGPRRHHRTERSRSDRDDDPADSVGRAPVRATRNGRGGRAVGGSSDGQGASPRFPRKRQGRDRA